MSEITCHCHLHSGESYRGTLLQIDSANQQIELMSDTLSDTPKTFSFQQVSHLYHNRTQPTEQQQAVTITFSTGALLDTDCLGSTQDASGYWLYHLGRPTTATHLFIPQGSPHTVTLQSSRPIAEQDTVTLVETLLHRAIEQRASDIHLRPLSDRVELKYRIDGEMVLIRHLDPANYPALVSRIKILSNMDIAEHRKPQDGSHHLQFQERQVDLRISTVIVIEGESVAIRILDPKTGLRALSEIGFRNADEARFRSLLQQPSGLILVTGPTGSGKSTTLYAAMRALRERKLNIISLEDPVEYRIDQVRQIEINEAAGSSFPNNLRHILRHDPDVILIGEIRDEETARIALQSAYTGHLVLSTLHTGDAPSAVPRLLEMGIEPYMLKDTLLGVLSQRLVRSVCSHCHGEATQMVHCTCCHQTGYHGRIPLYELMAIDENIRNQIETGVTAQTIRTHAIHAGMTPMQEYAKTLIEQHATQPEEIERHETT